MKGKHFLKLLDFTPEEICKLLDMAAEFKKQNGSIICRELLEGVESSTASNPVTGLQNTIKSAHVRN